MMQTRRSMGVITVILIGLGIGLFIKNVKIGLVIGLFLGITAGSLLGVRK